MIADCAYKNRGKFNSYASLMFREACLSAARIRRSTSGDAEYYSKHISHLSCPLIGYVELLVNNSFGILHATWHGVQNKKPCFALITAVAIHAHATFATA